MAVGCAEGIEVIGSSGERGWGQKKAEETWDETLAQKGS